MKETNEEQYAGLFGRILFIFFAVILLSCSLGIRVQAAKAPNATTIKSIANQDGSVKITWKKIKKATGYYVYRKKENGTYKKIATIKSGDTTSYTDATVKSGKLYRYKVQAFNKTGEAKKSVSAKTRYLRPVTIKKAAVNDKTVTLQWSKRPTAAKYKIYRKTSTSDYKLIATIGKSKNTYTDTSVSYGKSYTYMIYACKGNYQSKGISVSCNVLASIETVTTKYAMEADVMLTGSGEGYHAKLVMAAPDAALSFGIEYDVDASYPYTGKAFFLVENIHSNSSYGQAYWRVREATLGQSYKLMMTLTSKGTCRIYINGLLIDSVTNTELPADNVTLRVEGAAKHNGNTVNATFKNIKLKSGSHTSSANWVADNMRTDERTSQIGIYPDLSQFASSRSISIRGTLRGLNSGQDWDSSETTKYGYPGYDSVSGGAAFKVK